MIIFLADNGGTTPWFTGEVLDRGTRVPLIVRLPRGTPPSSPCAVRTLRLTRISGDQGTVPEKDMLRRYLASEIAFVDGKTARPVGR